MGYFSHVWERMKGNARSGKPVKSLKNRSLRMESLEDRALLSVTTAPVGGAVPEEVCVSAVVSTVSGAVIDDFANDASLSTDVPISLSIEAGEDAADAAVPNMIMLPRPENVKVSGEGYNVRVTWECYDGGLAIGYRVCWGKSSVSMEQWSTCDTGSQQKWCELTVTGLSGEYSFKVQTLGDDDSFLSSDYTDPVSIELPVRKQLDKPVITDVEVDTSDGYNVTVTWDPVENAERYGVAVRKKDSPLMPSITFVTETSYTFTADDFSGPGTYTIEVTAWPSNDSDLYVRSDVRSSDPIDVPLFPPENLNAYLLDDVTAMVTWSPVADAAGYTLRYKKADSADWENVVTGLTDTSYKLALEKDALYQIEVNAVADVSKPSQFDSGYARTLIASLSPWDLANWSDYTNFEIDMDTKTRMGYLYGISKNGVKEVLIDGDRYIEGQTLTVYSDNTARTVTLCRNAASAIGHLVYIGGRTKNDTIILKGSDHFSESFVMDQLIAEVEVHERPGVAPKTREVTFDTVTTYVIGPGNGVEANDRVVSPKGNVSMSGVKTVTIDAGVGDDSFSFRGKVGTTYNLIGGDGVDTLDFSMAPTGVKVDMGKTKAQQVLSGKICLNGDIEAVVGSIFKDTITTAVNTTAVNTVAVNTLPPANSAAANSAEPNKAAANKVEANKKEVERRTGSDTINLVGDRATETTVFLNGDSQKVKARGEGVFTVEIVNGSLSTVNMSSVKKGRLILEAEGNKIKVTGTKGDDNITVSGSDADIQGGDGDDTIIVTNGLNAKVRAGAGNDFVDLFALEGNNTIDGGTGNNLLIGGRGSDCITVRSGNNVLIGNEGKDKLTGGRGRDLIIANSTEGIDDKFGLAIYYRTIYTGLADAWWNGMYEEIIMSLGTVSTSDGSKDILKRGSGADNFFYANPETDFDTVDYKPEKGDLLFGDASNQDLLLYDDPLDDGILPETGTLKEKAR